MENNLKFDSAICTSRVQSERLLALGLKKETADIVLLKEMVYDEENHCTRDGEGYLIRPIEYLEGEEHRGHIPAWSLGRLIEMMPFDVVPEGGFDNIFTLTKDTSGYSVEYDGFSYYYKKNIYDTLIEGIEHLIKEGYFNKEYLV